jgi:hypothetical protein
MIFGLAAYALRMDEAPAPERFSTMFVNVHPAVRLRQGPPSPRLWRLFDFVVIYAGRRRTAKNHGD